MEKTKFQLLKENKAPLENRQLLIMAQSCQHDAAKLIGDQLGAKDYDSVKKLAADIAELRDLLLEDLVEKYYI